MMAAQGSHAEAEAEYRAVLDARTRVVGTEHPDTLATRYEIARRWQRRAATRRPRPSTAPSSTPRPGS